MYKNTYIIFFLLLMAIAGRFAGEVSALDLPWKPQPRVGCWVRYHFTLPRGNPLHGRDLYCTVKVLSIDGTKISVEYTLEGLPPSNNGADTTIIMNDDHFSPERMLGLSLPTGPEPPAVPVKFRVKGQGKEVEANKLVTESSVEKGLPELEVIRSREIPFGLAKVSGKGVLLEVDSFSWGDKIK